MCESSLRGLTAKREGLRVESHGCGDGGALIWKTCGEQKRKTWNIKRVSLTLGVVLASTRWRRRATRTTHCGRACPNPFILYRTSKRRKNGSPSAVQYSTSIYRYNAVQYTVKKNKNVFPARHAAVQQVTSPLLCPSVHAHDGLWGVAQLLVNMTCPSRTPKLAATSTHTLSPLNHGDNPPRPLQTASTGGSLAAPHREEKTTREAKCGKSRDAGIARKTDRQRTWIARRLREREARR